MFELTRSDCVTIYEVSGASGLIADAGRDVSTLSDGERQCVWIAMALAQQATPIVLLDPTHHLSRYFSINCIDSVRSTA